MPEIRRLPDGVVNRIAAGEVIERPAAALRELIENALDAGATRVSVRLEGGGISLIEVTDNGHGMSADGLALAVQRHCTSKLADGDLVRIATLGFRGEALPSVGAAARLAITSREAGSPHAHRIAVEGGAISPVAPASGPPGTRVTVTDLFYATPARRKFLRSPRAEAEAAEAALRRLALAAPAVAVRLESDGALVFDLPAQDRTARLSALLGEEAGGFATLDGRRGAASLSGAAAPPTLTRATGAQQFFVVNGRPVTDPVLRTALKLGYREVIAAGRHPVAALFLDLPAEEVDVNVHPAKAELRFRDKEGITALVIGTVQRAVARSGLAASRRPAPSFAFNTASRHAGGFAEAPLPLGPPAARAPAPDPPAPDPAYPLGAPVAQVLDTYLLAVTADGALVIVDQHAAHERLTEERLRAEAAARGIRAQKLLVPAVVDLPPPACRLLADHAHMLAEGGLLLEPFGPGAVLVSALPAALGAPDPAPLLRDLADELAEAGDTAALAERLDRMIKRMACHGSIRAGRRLSPPEMDALLRDMERTPRASTCSHGRPTAIRLTRVEIERLFGRR